jgi:hypothetical protein
MRGVLISYLIKFMPLVIAGTGWAKAYRARKLEPLHPFAVSLLAVVTVFVAVEAGAFIFFESRPINLPPWESPEVPFFARFFLIGLFFIALSFLAFRMEPRWLFWVLGAASFWATGVGFLVAMAY